jgi:hypothetical protein
MLPPEYNLKDLLYHTPLPRTAGVRIQDQIWSIRGPKIFIFSSFIYAPHKGDEALVLLSQYLSELAQKHNITIFHEAIPLTEASDRLFARTEGFTIIEEQEGGHIWRKKYSFTDK